MKKYIQIKGDRKAIKPEIVDPKKTSKTVNPEGLNEKRNKSGAITYKGYSAGKFNPTKAIIQKRIEIKGRI